MSRSQFTQSASDDGGRRHDPRESETKPVRQCFSRREFLLSTAGIMLGGIQWPSLDDDMLAARDHSLDHIAPEKGEVLPEDRLPPAGRDEGGVPLFNSRDLFLTFDDGPLSCTGEILDVLAQTGHKATFFVIGRNLTNARLRRLAIRALEEGHDIGNHSYSHPSFSSIPGDRAAREILKAHNLIEDLVREARVDPVRQNLYFRFPFGDAGNSWNYRVIQNTLDELGYGEAWWDLDTNDWRMELQWFPRPPSKVIATFKRARPHDVVLLHDRATTARYLPEMLNVVDALELVSTTLSDIELGPRVHVAQSDLDRILKAPDFARANRTDASWQDLHEWLLPVEHVPSVKQRTVSGTKSRPLSTMW